MIAQKSQLRKCKKLETLREQPEITNKLVTETEDTDSQAICCGKWGHIQTSAEGGTELFWFLQKSSSNDQSPSLLSSVQ